MALTEDELEAMNDQYLLEMQNILAEVSLLEKLIKEKAEEYEGYSSVVSRLGNEHSTLALELTALRHNMQNKTLAYLAAINGVDLELPQLEVTVSREETQQ